MLTARIRNRPKPKKIDGERSKANSYVSIVFHCCSILSDRKETQYGERSESEEEEHGSLFTITSFNGGVAQLGEHLPCKQGVKGSIPFISTKGESKDRDTPKRTYMGS